MTDALRLAFGTFTTVRVPPPRRITKATAGGALLLGPLVGLLLGVCAEAVVLPVRWSVQHWQDGLLAPTIGVAVLALLSRGIHLDGLADTVDGLASGRRGADGVEVMRRSDVGPLGVAALVLVLLVDVSALGVAVHDGRGTLALVGGAVVGRLAVAWSARPGVPAADSRGIGSVFAGSVRLLPLLAVTVLVAGVLTLLTVADDDLTLAFVPRVIAALVVALAVSQLLVRRAVSRFGGVTGDVFGGVVESAFCAYVLVVCLG